MTTKIGGVVVDIDARLTKLESSLAKADRDFKKFERNTYASGKRIESSVGGIGKSFNALKGVIGGAVIGFGVQGLTQLGRAALETADELGTAAERAGVGVERFQTLKEVFRVAEVDAAAFDKGLARLTGTLGDVTRGVQDEATKALDQMGISTKILSGEITTTDQLLDAIADSSRSFGSEAEFTSAAIDIFGQKLGTQFAPALMQGTEAIHEAEQALRDAGLVVDEFAVKQLADANEAIDAFTSRTSVSFTNWAGSIVADIQFLSDETSAYLDMLANGDIGSFLTTSARQAAEIGRMSRGLGNNPLSNGVGSASSVFFDAMNTVTTASARANRPSTTRTSRGGGGSRRSSGGGSKGLSEEQRLTAEYDKQIVALERQIKLDFLRGTGAELEADLLEDNLALEEKFGKLGKEKLDAIKAQNQYLVFQKQRLEEINKLAGVADVYGLNDQGELEDQLMGLVAANGFGADSIEAQNVRIAKSFQDSANDSIAAIQSLSNAVQGGGFLDILSSVVGLGLQLGSIGAFGSKIAGNINSTKGFAKGTNFAPGGLAWVGEDGPELMNVPRGAQITPNNLLRGSGPNVGGGMGIQIVPSKYFDVVVQQQAVSVAAPMAVNATVGGASLAQQQTARKNSRSLV